MSVVFRDVDGNREKVDEELIFKSNELEDARQNTPSLFSWSFFMATDVFMCCGSLLTTRQLRGSALLSSFDYQSL